MTAHKHDTQPHTRSLFNAVLRGKGAVAQSLQQAIAVATRGIYVGGENSGIVNTGFQVTINSYHTAGVGQSKPNKRTLARNLHTYLEWMQDYCDEMAAFTDPRPTSATANPPATFNFDLARVFVVLNVIEQNVAEPRPATCEHLLSLTPDRNVVLLADAGQGKSIILLNLARQLSEGMLVKRGWEDGHALQKALGFGSYKQLAVPFYLPLNVFAEALRSREIGLKDYLDQHLPRESFTLPPDFFSALVDHDHPIVLLLDGLDEILDRGLRERVAEHLRNLGRGKHNVRMVVSSRHTAYRGDSQMGSDVARFAIAPFDDDVLDKIVRALYLIREAGSGQDARKTSALLTEIKRLEAQRQAAGEVNRLIDSPLMAALAVQVREYTGQSLPRRRTDFLERAVEAMLNAGYAHEAMERALLSQAVGGWENHRRLLSVIALNRMQSGTRDITEPELHKFLGAAHVSPENIDPLLKFANGRGGLLRKQSDGRYWFIHLAIQQWLAAWHLIEQDLPANDLAAFFLTDDRIADEMWREVALLSAGLRREHANNPLGDNDRLANFLGALAQRALDATVSPTARFACAEVAVQAADDNLDHAHPVHARLTQPIADILEDGAAMATGALASRLFLGTWLTQHGDPRPHVKIGDAMQFCLVPRGPFQMGDDASDYADEKPLHEFDIPYDYWLGRYPITNAQFNEFVQDHGYANPAWWKVAHQAGAWQAGQVIHRVYRYGRLSPELQARVDALRRQERFGEADLLVVRSGAVTLGEERMSTPASVQFHQTALTFDDCVRRFPNHPVASISWYEALAYCAWLEARWRKAGWLTGDLHIELPSEAEWEKAARGAAQILVQPVIGNVQQFAKWPSGRLFANPNPLRKYPWGDEFSVEACNVEATGIHFTNTVGCFTTSSSAYGCQEMSGNVAEWTRSLYGRHDFAKRTAQCDFKYPYADLIKDREDLAASTDITRVARGGSWDYHLDSARCAYRNRNQPDFRVNFIGFRVCVRSAPVPPLRTL